MFNIIALFIPLKVNVNSKKILQLASSKSTPHALATVSFFQPKWILKMRVISIARARIPLMLSWV